MRLIPQWVAVACVISALLAPCAPVGAAEFAAPKFQQQWEKDEDAAPYFWGAPLTGGVIEQYNQAPGKVRLVQYFAKGRMETAAGQFSDGDLVTELLTGKREIGSFQFDVAPLPDTPLVGDGPGLTYATLGALLPALKADATKRIGGSVTTVVAAAGDIRTLPDASVSGPEAIDSYSFSHNVIRAFTEYGERWRASGNAFRLGFPLTEPFRTRVFVGGAPRDVIMQVFTSRILVYTPSNPDTIKVEAVNAGEHYLAWRYAASLPQAATGPLPVVVQPDKNPAAMVLASGGATQTGKPGYAAWCATDASGNVAASFIADTFDMVAVPSDQLPVAAGSPLTLTYQGADTLAGIGAIFYDFAKAGKPSPDGLYMLPRGQDSTRIPVTLAGKQGTLTASISPGSISWGSGSPSMAPTRKNASPSISSTSSCRDAPRAVNSGGAAPWPRGSLRWSLPTPAALSAWQGCKA